MADAENNRAASFARLIAAEHHDAHGGAFAIGEVVGAFANFGDSDPDSPVKQYVRDKLAEQGIEELEFGTADDDYSWAMLVNVRPDDTEAIECLRAAVRDGVRSIKGEQYPDWQFKII